MINNLLDPKTVSIDAKVGSELLSLPMMEEERGVRLVYNNLETEHDVPKLWRSERIKKIPYRLNL